MNLTETQISLRKPQMHTAELHVAEASVFATALVGAAKRAARLDPYASVASRLDGCPASRIWSLVHRPRTLKSIASHIREGLAEAYARELERQRRLLDHDIAIATKAGASRRLLDEASALAGAVGCEVSQ